MGLLKKVFKGIGKVFKKIGRGIKKAFKAFGKFMGKIGFVGQMAMMFLFPAGIGNMFIKGLGSLGKTLAAVGGPSGGLFAQAVQGVGRVLLKVRDFAVGAKAGFSSITDGIKEFGKTALNKVGEATGLFKIDSAAANFFGEGDTAFSRTMDSFSETGDIIRGLKDKSFTVSSEKGLNIDDFSDQMGISKEDLFKLNPGLEVKLTDGITIPQNTYVNLDLAQGSLLGFDPEKISQINQQAIADAFIGPPAPARDLATNFVGPQPSTAMGPFRPETNVTDTATQQFVGPPAPTQANVPVAKEEVLTADVAAEEAIRPKENLKLEKGSATLTVDSPLKRSIDKTLTPKDNIFSARLARATRGLRPGEVGLVESVKNWKNLASPFMGSPEDVSFQRPGDIIDVSSNIAQYTPEPIPNFMQSMMGGNMFGSPALMEQLQYYGLYRPDTMSRTA